ncbi:MAG: recombinase family protein, partial [Candidatus Omnitrophota bacterium]
MTTCAIYTRVSSKDQAVKGFSLDAQEKIGKELCKRNKWQYDVFVESGRSADKETLDNRPSLEKILDIAEDKNIQFLFVTELDRLSRNPVTLAYIKKILSDNDIKVITPSQTFDFRDDEDDFMSDLLGILAKRENRLRVKRSRRAKDEAVRLGRWVGATLPFGFTKQPCVGDRLKHNQIVPHPQEKKIYLQMVEWSLSGIGTNSIAAKLTEMGVPTRFSNEKKTYKWKAGVVLRILRNPIYKGDYSFGKASSTIGGIISPEKWQVLQENLKKNYNNAARNTKRFYLLRGLLRCKRCGNRLYGMIKPRKGMRCYCCASKRP